MRGRPSFKPTADLKRKVAIAAGGGMSHEEISLALGISRPTLEKHFAHELTVVAYQKRMEALAGMHRAAKKGNVAAAKAYLAIAPRATLPADVPLPPEGDTKEPKLGKKDQANADAVTAAKGSEWENLLPGAAQKTH